VPFSPLGDGFLTGKIEDEARFRAIDVETIPGNLSAASPCLAARGEVVARMFRIMVSHAPGVVCGSPQARAI
jgi:aryl-alcohol dehydrogenase-like predicted oxidoreductase